MRAAWEMLSSGLKLISGARRRRSARPTRERKCPATLANPSNVVARSASDPITLTNTLACRRSCVTSAPVTVTSPVMRGSFTSSARKVATSWRMAAATRSARRWSVATPGSGLRGGRERARHLFGAIALDDIADFDVVEVLDGDTTLEPFAHFAHVVLEPLERRDGPVEYLDTIANHANATLAVDDAAANRAAGDRPDARDLEHFAHFGLTQNNLALLGTKHSFHRRANVGHRFVNDAVQLDLN